jgi:hypothetical protein
LKDGNENEHLLDRELCILYGVIPLDLLFFVCHQFCISIAILYSKQVRIIRRRLYLKRFFLSIFLIMGTSSIFLHSATLLMVLFFGWGNVQISLGIFLSSFFNNSRAATSIPFHENSNHIFFSS